MLRSRTSSPRTPFIGTRTRAGLDCRYRQHTPDRCSLDLLEPNLELLEPIYVFGTDTEFREFAYIGLGRLTCYSMPEHARWFLRYHIVPKPSRAGHWVRLEAIAAGY